VKSFDSLTNEQLVLIDQGCADVWPIERLILRRSLARNFRRKTPLVTSRIQKDGIGSVAHLIIAGPWLLLAAVFGLLSTSTTALATGQVVQDVSHLCVGLFLVTFLVGIARLSIVVRSKTRYHSIHQ
jgi:hypothetical protein